MITENESGPEDMSDQERDLEHRAFLALDTRRDAGLEGLVGNLDTVIIATEPDHLVPSVYELLRYTGLSCVEAFFEPEFQSVCAECTRLRIGHNPFTGFDGESFY